METDARQARAVTAAALDRDPGPMSAASGLSHQVYVGAEVVLKVIDADRHARLDREVALAPSLPAGLTAPLLASGVHTLASGKVRYACYTRAAGATPGMGLPRVGARTACALAEQAVRRLGRLHQWTPPEEAARILREPLEHGGFVSRAALVALIERVAAADRAAIVPHRLLDGVAAIAAGAPPEAGVTVPVHADCHWGNWLASDGRLTALLDFEWARFGEPLDDWFFLISDSGAHFSAVLNLVARATGIGPATMRAACEVRAATHLASDILLALTRTDLRPGLLAARLTGLEKVVVGRRWWR